MNTSTEPRQNELLAALPPTEWQRWLPQLEHVEMPLGQLLCETGRTSSHVYFPTTAVVSLVSTMRDGAPAEVATVGNDGMVCISLFMGGQSTTTRAVVRIAGRGLRLPAQVMKEEFNRSAVVMTLMLRYTQALIAQMGQLAACNRRHTIEQQLCRLLLGTLDRVPGNGVQMTQELIANTLGVRREGVTVIAHKFQAAGLISYARGHIIVLDRSALEQRSCECYREVRTECRRLRRPVMVA
jgi:CRP-like cAMP-binding protein